MTDTAPLAVRFVGGETGAWVIRAMDTLRGDPLPPARRLAITLGAAEGTPTNLSTPTDLSAWSLRGIVSNGRYTTRTELDALASRQEGLGRTGATRAALIPIRKSAAWWALAQDERREILEEQSHHIAIGMDYLPAVSRRLHHGRDLGEPFDFLTWFEYAPQHEQAFDDLVLRLRDTPEWRYVERETDIRLVAGA